jgi:hypothetical protein
VSARYQIRVAGGLDEAAAKALAGLDLSTRDSVRDAVTTITGEFDQAGLQGLLERIRSLGLDLLDARRVRASGRTARDTPGRGL